MKAFDALLVRKNIQNMDRVLSPLKLSFLVLLSSISLMSTMAFSPIMRHNYNYISQFSRVQSYHGNKCGNFLIGTSSCILQSTGDAEKSDMNIDNDGGWGFDNDDSDRIEIAIVGSDRELELASLRSQIDSKTNSNKIGPSSLSSLNGNKGTEDEVERDLFIPIFAVVSLLGLFGAYGYEMLRLYSRGELYIPGMH